MDFVIKSTVEWNVLFYFLILFASSLFVLWETIDNRSKKSDDNIISI